MHRVKFPLSIDIRKRIINGKVCIAVDALKENGQRCEFTTESKKIADYLIDDLWDVVIGAYEDVMGFPYEHTAERVNKDYAPGKLSEHLPEIDQPTEGK